MGLNQVSKFDGSQYMQSINKHLLIISNNDSLCDLIKSTFNPLDLSIDNVIYIDEAIHNFKAYEYDIIFIDMIMAGNEGYNLLTTIKESENTPYATIVICGCDQSLPAKLLNLGANIVFYNTPKPDDIQNIYQSYLENYYTYKSVVTPDIIVSYINDHFDSIKSRKHIAKIFSISEDTVSNHIMKYTNMTYYKYLTYCRLNKAKELLAKTNLNISQISERVGYRYPQLFSTVFHKNHNITPSEYRLKVKALKGPGS